MASHILSLVLAVILSSVVAVHTTAPYTIEVEDPVAYIPKKEIKADADHRLDNNDVVPSKYDLTITLADNFLDTKKFTGNLKITLSLKDGVPTSTKPIFIHAKDVTFPQGPVTLLKDGAPANLVSRVDSHAEYEKLEIHLATGTTLTTGAYYLNAQYEGTLNKDDMHGLYLSEYRSGNTLEHIVASQFQPTYARRLMPCFDEPKYKATFKLTLKYPKGYEGLSNMTPEKTDGDINNVITREFKETPKMSTYLLAIIVSKLHSTHLTQNNIDHAVWNRYPSDARSQYALQRSYQIIQAMKSITNIDTTATIGKVHHIALPDFSAGAMENWGIVTYREAALLLDPRESTTKNEKQVLTIIAHELAHFWFGNLVTTAWWDNTWLNEGFARYFEYMVADKVAPQMELDRQFVIEAHQAILNTDSVASAKAINAAAYTPSQVMGKFDLLTYRKGGSIIRMMSYWFNRMDDFYNGLSTYLNSHRDNTVIPADLWAAMSTIPNLPKDVLLPVIMNSYVNQPGLPVIKVALANNVIEFRQERFFLGTHADDTRHYYYVPITYTTGDAMSFDDTIPKGWLLNTEDSIFSFTPTNSDAMVIANIQSTAYARVNYDEVLWNRIIAKLRSEDFTKIHVLNRAQIVDDALNLARAGFLPTYERALDIISYLENELEYYPWYAAYQAIGYVLRRLPPGSNEQNQLKSAMLIMTENVHRTDVPNESSHIKALKKVLIQSWRCDLGDEDCIHEMTSLFNARSTSYLIPDVRSAAYCVGLRNAQTRDSWDELYERFSTTTLPSEAILILQALGCTRLPAVVRTYLDNSIALNSPIRSQDAETVLSAVLAGNPENLHVAVQFFKEKHVDIVARYPGSTPTSILSKLVDRFTTAQEVTDLRAWLQAEPNIPFRDDALILLTTAEANIRWADNNKQSIHAFTTRFLSDRQLPPVTPPTTTTESGSGSVIASSIFVFCNLCVVLYSRL